ncbi:hypothetical protein ACS0TY_003326 [Phlomoides rotata]
MVASWLLSSISKDIDTFVHEKLARELQNDICEQYGVGNGPKLLRLQKWVNTVKQGHCVYFMAN